MKRIGTEAYDALTDALASVVWNKQPFERLVRALVREHPELLARLNFADTKRMVATALVDLLAANEHRYRDLTLAMMLELAERTDFSNIIRQPDDEQRQSLLAQAKDSVTRLKKMTERYAEEYASAEALQAEIQRFRQKSSDQRLFESELDALKTQLMQMQSATDHHQRGRDFEKFLRDLFHLFNMEPRMAYSLENEQIDGALTFDTDDYILEARWRDVPVSRADADVFNQKVRRKGKNALGIFISATVFAEPALRQYSEGTSFLAVDGMDLYMVLDRRIRLDDLLLAKRRHANETGSCYLSAASV